jgi:hypothetical protein
MNSHASHDVQNKRRDALNAIEKAMLALHGLHIARRDRIMAKIARAQVALDEADIIVKSAGVVLDSNQETRDEEETCASGIYHVKKAMKSAAVREPLNEHEHILCGFEMATSDTGKEYNSNMVYSNISSSLLKKTMVHETACLEIKPEANSQVSPFTTAVTVVTVHSLIQESMSWLDSERAKEEINRSAADSPTNMDRIADRIAWLESMKLSIRGAATVTDQADIAKRLMAFGTEWLKQRRPSMSL